MEGTEGRADGWRDRTTLWGRSTNISRRNVMKTSGAAIATALLGSSNITAVESEALNAKTRTTLWTPEMRANAKRNIENHDWARERRDQTVQEANEYLDQYSLNDLWELVTGQPVARSAFPTPTLVYRNSPLWHSWEGMDRPWKMTDGEYVFPTNDFTAYRESGRDDQGVFDPDLADDQYLINEEHPEMGEGWGVDDGYGWQDTNDDLGQGEGAWWSFVGFYNHWAVWRPGGIVNMVEAFTDAYLFTGDQKYATAGTILLDRVADIYPDLDLSAYRMPIAGGHYRNGWYQMGKIQNSSWEPNSINPMVRAYDAFYPGMDEESIISFLDQKVDEYSGLDEKNSVEKIRKNIEDGIHRQILPVAKNGEMGVNRGARRTVCNAARVLDEPNGFTKEALEWVFKPGSFLFHGDVWHSEPDKWELTGGNTVSEMVGTEDRDGYFNEEAPLYNEIHMGSIEDVANILQGYDAFDGADLFEHPKFKRMLTQNSEIVLLDQHTPELGDSHVQRADNYMHTGSMESGFEVYGEPIFAQLWYFLNGNSTEGIRGGIFSAEPEKLSNEIARVVDEAGPFDPDSVNLAGYGFAALRDGENHSVRDETDRDANEKRAFWMYYGRSNVYGHNHSDALNLGVAGYELELAPDLGYPEDSGTWPKAVNWTKNTVSHNTVVVDEARQESEFVGVPHHFDSSDGQVQLMDIEAPEVYPQTDEYRRTTAMIRVDEANSYAVDFFNVTGGDDHHFSFHGWVGDVTPSNLDLTPQEDGTYAGPDVPKPGWGEDTEYNKEVGNGFNYLDNVSWDESPSGKFSLDWDIEDHWGVRDADTDVHLRLTMLDDIDDVALADGHPPQKEGNPESLRYLLAHRTGTDLQSRFTSVVEPYTESRFIDSTKSVPVVVEETGEAADARAVKVALSNGRTDYVVYAPDVDDVVVVNDTFRFEGFFGVYAEEDGEPVYAYVHDGTLLAVPGREPLIQRPYGAFTGTVEEFTLEMSMENEVTIQLDGHHNDVQKWIGDQIFIDTERSSDGDGLPRNGAYLVEDVQSGRDNRVTVDVGDRTFIKGFKNPDQLADGGYNYIISHGDEVRAPTTTTWSRADGESGT